jgi:hypothetical protein
VRFAAFGALDCLKPDGAQNLLTLAGQRKNPPEDAPRSGAFLQAARRAAERITTKGSKRR